MIKNAAVLTRKSLALLLSTVLVTQPLLVQAAELKADSNAGQQPGITKSDDGVPLVDIITPNANGLSHNKYSDFNVGAQGLILNNSAGGSSQSTIGGLVIQNPNLQDSYPAQVILNEVTGTGRSLLEGTIEVHGTEANVIIANPNGLTCNGCGFLNTPHVTLSTGTPELGDDLALKALTVRGGDVTIGAKGAKIGAKGANLRSVNVFDIVSRKISVEGIVFMRGDLNLVAGVNRFYYGTGEVEALPSDWQEPEVAIDSSALRGMYADRIKIISNDRGSGVNMQGHMAANTGALSITADGKLTLRRAEAKGELSGRSKSSSIHVDDIIFSEKAIVLEGHTSVELGENTDLYALGDVRLSAESVILDRGAVAGAGSHRNTNEGTFTVTADTLMAEDANLGAGKLLSIVAGEIYIASTKQEDSSTLRSNGNIEIKADSVHAKYALSTASGNIAIASENPLRLNFGQYRAGGLISIVAAEMTTSAELECKQSVTLKTTKGDLHNAGRISSEADARLTSAAGLANSGHILSMRKVEFNAAAQVSNNPQGTISGNQSVEAPSPGFFDRVSTGASSVWNWFLSLGA